MVVVVVYPLTGAAEFMVLLLFMLFAGVVEYVVAVSVATDCVLYDVVVVDVVDVLFMVS